MLVVTFIAMLLISSATNGIMGHFNLFADDVPTPAEPLESHEIVLQDSPQASESDTSGRMESGIGEEVLIGMIVMSMGPPMVILSAGVMYVWASSLASDTPDRPQNMYDANDASASITTANDDTLMHLYWSYSNDDYNWALMNVRLGVDGNYFSCSLDAGSDCLISQDGSNDQFWEAGEYITLSESNGINICGGGGETSCYVDISISYQGELLQGPGSINIG